MKSTYKLIGAFWDRKPEAREMLRICSYDSSYLPLGSQPCLFDYFEKKRRVTLSYLFALVDQSDFDTVTAELVDCSYIAIVLDYQPRVKSQAHRRFFWHRVFQVAGSLSEVLPDSQVVLMEQCEIKAAA